MSDEIAPLVGRGWRAHFEDEWVRDGRRLHIFRRLDGDRIEAVSGDLIVTTYDAAELVERSGIYLPSDAYQAIVAAIDPPAHKAEVARLEDALRVERERIDRILAAVYSGREGADS